MVNEWLKLTDCRCEKFGTTTPCPFSCGSVWP